VPVLMRAWVSHDGGMANNDDDIAKLLREVDALTSGKPAPKQDNSSAPVAKSQSSEVATTSKGVFTEHMLIAAAAGAIITFLVFLLPIIGSFGLLSRVLAGAIGGATGYAVARFLMRDKSDEGEADSP
jgi:hypothetical protein